MKISFVLAGVVALAALAGCAIRNPEVDQLAQRWMIGLSKKHILACMGEPARRRIIGSTQIWTYPVGATIVEGGLLAPGVNGMASGLGGDKDAFCKVNIVMTNAKVSQVYYSAPNGRPLMLGEQCEFAVENCIRP